MVKDSGAAIRPHQLRPLNLPRAISVETARGRPVALVDPRARLESVAVRSGGIEAEISVRANAEPAKMPKSATFMKDSTATKFVFDTSAARLGS